MSLTLRDKINFVLPTLQKQAETRKTCNPQGGNNSQVAHKLGPGITMKKAKISERMELAETIQWAKNSQTLSALIKKPFSIPKVENLYNTFPGEFQNCGGQHSRCCVSLVLSIYDNIINCDYPVPVLLLIIGFVWGE